MFLAMGYGVYYFFASLMILSVFFVYFLMPETKGIPLEAMDRLFDRKLVPRHAHAIVLAELKADEEVFRSNFEGTGLAVEKGERDERVEEV